MHETLRLSAESPEDLLSVIAVIQRGDIVAVPTETVYGLAADARNDEGIRKIFMAKNRPTNHPLIVHIESYQKLDDWAQNIPACAFDLAQAFWPGPLTLLLKKRSHVSDLVSGGLDTIALRVPAHPILLKIIEELDTGLAAPSANLHKQISPTTAAHVLSQLDGRIAAVLEGGSCSFGIESTILDLTQNIPTLMRKGPITQKMIEDILGFKIQDQCEMTANIPGNMKEHYQPKTRAFLWDKTALLAYIVDPGNKDKKFGVLSYTPLHIHDKHLKINMPNTQAGYSSRLYSALHEADRLGVDEILIQSPPDDPAWEAVMDRLQKATYRNNPA